MRSTDIITTTPKNAWKGTVTTISRIRKIGELSERIPRFALRGAGSMPMTPQKYRNPITRKWKSIRL